MKVRSSIVWEQTDSAKVVLIAKHPSEYFVMIDGLVIDSNAYIMRIRTASVCRHDPILVNKFTSFKQF